MKKNLIKKFKMFQSKKKKKLNKLAKPKNSELVPKHRHQISKS